MKKVLIIGLIGIIAFLGSVLMFGRTIIITDKEEYYLGEVVGFGVKNFSIYTVSYVADCGPDFGFQKWDGTKWESKSDGFLFSCLSLIANIYPLETSRFYLEGNRIKEPGIYRIDFKSIGVSNSFVVKDVVKPFEFVKNTPENLKVDQENLTELGLVIEALEKFHGGNFEYPQEYRKLKLSSEILEKFSFDIFKYSVTADNQAYCVKTILKTMQLGPSMAKDDGIDPFLYEKGKGCDLKNYIVVKEKNCPFAIPKKFIEKIGTDKIELFISDLKNGLGVAKMEAINSCTPKENEELCLPEIIAWIGLDNLQFNEKRSEIEVEIESKFKKMLEELNKRTEFSKKAEYIREKNFTGTNVIRTFFVLKKEFGSTNAAKAIKEFVGTYFYGLIGEIETKYYGKGSIASDLRIDLSKVLPSIDIILKIPTADELLMNLKEKWNLDLSESVYNCINPPKKAALEFVDQND